MLGILSEEIDKLSIAQVIREFSSSDSLIPKRELVRQAGKILRKLAEGGEQAFFVVENFLAKVLTDDDGILARATAGFRNGAQRAYQASKMQEDCYAYLSVCEEKLQPDTKKLLREIEAKPPSRWFSMESARQKFKAETALKAA